MTKKQIDDEIMECKWKLHKTDYEAIKHSEGLISDEDYEPIKEQRQSWRDRINELENTEPEEEIIDEDIEMVSAEIDNIDDNTNDIDNVDDGE